MQSHSVWHVKVRRFDHNEYEIAEIWTDERRVPEKDEIIKVGVTDLRESGTKYEKILGKVMSFTESVAHGRTRYTVLVAEQDYGNPLDRQPY